MFKKLPLTIICAILLSFLMPASIASGAVAVPPQIPGNQVYWIEVTLNPVNFAAGYNRPSFSWHTDFMPVLTFNDSLLHIAIANVMAQSEPEIKEETYNWVQTYNWVHISADHANFNDNIIRSYYTGAAEIGIEEYYTIAEGDELLEGEYFWKVISCMDQDCSDAWGESDVEGFNVVNTIDSLILKYEPVLYFHPDEDFYPMNVEPFVENSSLWDSHGLYEVDELLKDESDDNPVILDDLTPQSQDTANYTANWYLQFSQDLVNKTPDPAKAKAEYQALVSSSQAKPAYYARRMEDSYADDQGTHEFTVLQYWYFYAFNDFGAKVEKGNNHEGDWESVMVFLDKETENPQFVAYSAHHNIGEPSLLVGSFDSVRRNWDSNEIVKEIVEGEDRVVSFVGLGSHASYPNNGEDGIHPIPVFSDDYTSDSGVHLGIENNRWIEDNIFVFNESNFPLWFTDYKGKWGVDYPRDLPIVEDQSGPQSPFYQDKFNHPVQWAGIDKIGQKTITEQGIVIVEFIQSNTKMVFEQALDIGTEIAVDLHNEVVSLGQNLQNLLLAPHFWDITSTLINNDFNVEVSFIYNPEETQVLGITNPARLTVFVYAETGQIWQEVPSKVDINNNIIKFQTDHFSRYAIGIKKIQFQDITDKVKIIENKKHYDKKTGIQEIDFRIKNNSSEQIKGMFLLSISNLAEGIEFVNPDNLISLSLISTGLPENLQAVDFTDSYRYCLFTGQESDIPGTIDKETKNRLLKEKPIKDKRCSEISSIYPELSLFLEDVLPAHKYTEDKTLQFKVPDKKMKRFEYEARMWGEVKK